MYWVRMYRVGKTQGFALSCALLAALLDFSCQKPIPPVPSVSLNSLDGDVRSAIQKAHDEAVAQPRSARASGDLGMVLQAHTLYQPALLAYQRAIRLDPKDFAWQYYLAVSLRQTGQLDQALATVTDALRLRPDYSPAVLERGELLLKLGRFPESGAAIEPLVKQDPDSPLALYDLGRVKFSQQDFAAAADLYRRATQAYPKYGAAWFALAEANKRLDHRPEAEKDYQFAESYKDDHPRANDPLMAEVEKRATGIQSRLTLAKSLQDARQFDRAVALYREVLKQYPDNLEALVNLLYIAHFPNQSTPQEAEELYTRARAANPQYPQVYLYHGTVLAAQGKFDPAVAEIQKAIQLKPNDAEAHAWLADVREQQHRTADAIDQYQIALSQQPDFRAVRLELAKNLLHAGRSSEAIPVLLPALKIDDASSPVVLMFLAQAYLNMGDRQNAIKYLSDAHEWVLRNGQQNLLPQIEQGLRSLGSGN
jgi:tetratricopeptide (TPR) repeat protein